MAKGARRPTSVLRGHLEPLTHVVIVFYKKDGREIHTLSQSDTVDSFRELHIDFERFAYSSAVCELVDRFIPPEGENRGLFDLVMEILRAMESSPHEDLMAVLWSFELRLLGLLGFQPELGACVCCKGEVEGRPLGFSLSKGGVLCWTCAETDEEAHRFSLESLHFLRYLQRVRAEKVAIYRRSGTSDSEIDNLLQAFLKYHTDDFRAIRSLQVLNAVQAKLSPSERKS